MKKLIGPALVALVAFLITTRPADAATIAKGGFRLLGTVANAVADFLVYVTS